MFSWKTKEKPKPKGESKGIIAALSPEERKSIQEIEKCPILSSCNMESLRRDKEVTEDAASLDKTKVKVSDVSSVCPRTAKPGDKEATAKDEDSSCPFQADKKDEEEWEIRLSNEEKCGYASPKAIQEEMEAEAKQGVELKKSKFIRRNHIALQIRENLKKRGVIKCVEGSQNRLNTDINFSPNIKNNYRAFLSEDVSELHRHYHTSTSNNILILFAFTVFTIWYMEGHMTAKTRSSKKPKPKYIYCSCCKGYFKDKKTYLKYHPLTSNMSFPLFKEKKDKK